MLFYYIYLQTPSTNRIRNNMNTWRYLLQSFRMKVLPILFLFGAPGLVGICQATTPEDLVAGTTTRIDALFKANKGKPLVREKVLAPLGSGRAYYSRAYSWSVTGFAARCFYLNEKLPEANAALIQNGKYYLRQLTAQEEASILDSNAGEEGNTSPYSRITSRDTVHWHADTILRLIDMYGSNGSVVAGRMSAEAEAKSLEYISQYVRLIGKLSKAEYLQSKTWDSYESENHHAMDFRTHWHFSKIAKDHPDYQNFTTNSGATPSQLYEAYNNYFIEYARERFRKGLFSEMMNRGYNSATYSGFYNFYDFGIPEVREHARMLLDLFWAYYAQEQFNDVVGGGASRVDFDAGFSAGHQGTTGAFAWFYFGMVSAPSGVDGRSINPYFSSYRPPAVVADIATDIAGRGTYEIRQTAQGLGTTGSTNPDVSQALTPHRLRTDGGGVVRYSYCDPAFIMGLPMVEARPSNNWVDYSSQSRWQGVIFSEDRANEMARIVPCVKPNSGDDTFNAHWGVQSKGSMITQMLNTHEGGKEMWVFISKQGLNANPTIENNIVFVDIAGAYAAIRVVGTTFTLHEDYDSEIRPHWLVRPADRFKPVILEVMAKTVEPNFEAFKTLVKTNPPVFANNLVTHTTIYGELLTFDASRANPPTINGVPVDYSPAKSFDSPYLHGDYNGDTFVIEKGSRRKVYSFPAPSPAESLVDVLVSNRFLTPETTATHTISNLNVPDGTDKLVLAVSWENASASISATWNGTEPFAVAANSGAGNGVGRNSAILYLDNPTTTTADLIVTFGGATEARVGVLGLSGAPAGVSVTSTAPGFTGSLTTTADSTLVIGVCTNNLSGGSLTGGPFAATLYNGSSGSSAGNAGYQIQATAGAVNYTWTGTANSPTVALAGFVLAATRSFLQWIGGYPSVDDQTFMDDDPDGDGIANGIEAWFGTHPGEWSQGLANLMATSNTVTFTHPQSENPPSDLSIIYQWSTNLVDWYDCDGVDGPVSGETVSANSDTVGTTTTVTTTASGPIKRLFLRAGVRQNLE